MSQAQNSSPFLIINGFHENGSHGFFGRRAGNMSLLAPRDQAAAQDNRNNALAALVPDSKTYTPSLAILKQTHSADVVTIRSDTDFPLPNILEGDALVTKEKNIALGVLTADCAPILFYAKDNHGTDIIGAAHAGWRGALGGVLENTIQAMLVLNAKLDTMQTAIGPCIAQASYEVHEDFIAPFLNDDPLSIQFFAPSKEHEDKLHFDLSAYCAHRLQKAGIIPSNIYNSSVDTYSNKKDYFSHRRATHKKKPDIEGRQASIILLT